MPKLKRDALAIFRAGLAAADPSDGVRHALKTIKLGDGPVYVVGAGKAAATMALAAERVLGSRIAGGLINVKDGHVARLRRIEINECSHPVPDERGVAGAERIAAIAAGAGAGSLVLCLVSGGASALLPLPAEGITLADKQDTTRELLACGATIHEINAVRKHLSRIKGGRLAELARPARVVSLLLSDVIGDDLSVIGSGPTAPDDSTFESALAVLDKYAIRNRVCKPVLNRLEAGARGEIEETPKRTPNATNRIIGSNALAVAAAAAKARELGYRTQVLATTIDGEAREVAGVHAAIAREARRNTCILSGGETTVTLRGDGKGGRNQEFALAAAIRLAGVREIGILCAGTDGSDGPTDAAGAYADSSTIARAERRLLDARAALRRNDSYTFFAALGDLVKTGPTGTNVMDLNIFLVAR